MSKSPVIDVLAAFESLTEQEIATREHQALLDGVPGPERALLYALRVSTCLPKLRKLETLASRWGVAHGRPDRTGLLAGVSSPNYERVRNALVQMYLYRFDELAGELVAETGSSKASTPERLRKATERAKALLDAVVAQFVPEPPGLSSKKARWRAALDSAADAAGPLEDSPAV